MFACQGKWLDHTFLCVVGFVGDQDIGFDSRKKSIGALQIMGLAWCEMKACRVAERINGGVDFGA